jgi:putative transposase
MARPGRNASAEDILRPTRTFFATTKTSMGRQLLQSERNAGLLIDVLRALVAERMFELHDFVIMPDHVHLLLTVGEGMTIEKAMQLIKGRFSFSIEEGIWIPRGGLATRVSRSAGVGSAQFRRTSRLYC